VATDLGRNPPPSRPGRGPPVLDEAFDGDSLSRLRAALGACARHAGLSAASTDDVVIAVHELAANTVRHGAGHGQLRAWLDNETLHCEVSDDGAPPAAGTGPWDVVPGHGLWLVRRLAGHVGVRTGPGGTVAAVSFALRPGPEPAG
jgi:anti-sigma regulatory factor (Ser/Thr protein kinase)